MLQDESTPSHPLSPRSGVRTDETIPPLPCTTKCFSRLKDLTGRKAGGFFSPILILYSQLCERDDQSPKPEPRPTVFSFCLPPPPPTLPLPSPALASWLQSCWSPGGRADTAGAGRAGRASPPSASAGQSVGRRLQRERWPGPWSPTGSSPQGRVAPSPSHGSRGQGRRGRAAAWRRKLG